MRWNASLLGGILLAGMTLAAGDNDADTTKKLLGVWQITKSESLPPGALATAEFTKNGAIKLHAVLGEKLLAANGTYKVKGNTVVTIIDYGGKSRTETSKIKKLTEDVLILEDEKGRVDEYKRKKGS